MGLFSEGERKGAQWIRLTEDPRESPLKLRKVKTNGLAWFKDEMIIRNQDDDPPVMRASYPAAHIRKEFRLEHPVKEARLYVSGLGRLTPYRYLSMDWMKFMRLSGRRPVSNLWMRI